MSATSGGGGSVSEGSDAGGSSQSTMSVNDSPSTSFQTNLVAENVTKITLSEENGTGGYVTDMTGSKINLTLDERQQKDGIINVAFDYEEGVNRGGGGVGGEFRSVNGSEKKDKIPEAVNLELVNMVPYSNGNGTSYGVPVNGIPGIPMKKDSEQVDMSTPYDEYFVPVNEHKKYMRGEKLYVTKDKRRPTSWRRCLSWIVACTVISVVLIIAILAGTGVILSQEPDLVKDASVGRNFAGSNLKPSVTNKLPAPTAEKLMYVPRSIESEFVIDNLDFDLALRDLNSSAYQQFKSNMENQLKMLLFDKETLEFGASDVGVKVVNISRDPFKVNYRIGWNYKQGVNNPPEPIKMEDVKRKLVESLATNQGYIDKYHIDREAIKVNHVINECQMENGGCSHICYYNYRTQLFTCTCPTHLVLDSTGKNCVPWSGSSEDDALLIPSHAAYPGMPYESTLNPIHEFEHSSDFHHGVQQGVHYHQESNSEHSTESEYKSHGDQEHGDLEPAAEPIPEPTSEPNPGQEYKAHITSEVILKPTPVLNVKEKHQEELDHDFHADGVNSHHDKLNTQSSLKPTAEPTSGSKYHDQAHFVYESAGPAAETVLSSTARQNNNSAVHSANESKNGEPTAEPIPEPAPEPVPELNPESDNHDYAVHSVHDSKNHEPAAEPTPESAPKPTPEPGPEPAGEHYSTDKIYSVHSLNDSKDRGSSAVPTPEPSPQSVSEISSKSYDHDYAVYSVHDSKNHEPAAEPTPEPAPEPSPGSHDHEPAAEPTAEPAPEPSPGSHDHEPVAEPTPEPAPEPNPGSHNHDQILHSVYDSKNHEPAAEPTAEPAPEPSPGSHDHEPAAEPTAEPAPEPSPGSHDHEPAAEPTPEPAPEPNPGSQDHDQIVHSVYDSKNHEPAAEPTPEPAPEPNPVSQDHDHIVHSVYDSKNHEPAAEPTAEPSPGSHDDEPAAEPTPEPAPELSPGSHDHDQVVHSVHDSKNHEAGVEPIQEPTAELKTESSPEDQGKGYGVQSRHEIKDLSESKTVDILINSNQATENSSKYTPKPISELSRDDDHQTHSSKVQGNERLGTVTIFTPSRDEMNSGPNSTDHDSTEQPGQQLDLAADIKTGYTIGAHPNRQNEPDKKNKSEHQMPHLHDILVRTSSNLEKKNATTHGQNILQSVELKENGEPVFEEVLVDKSETSSPAMTSKPHSGNELDLSKPKFAEDSPDLKNVVTEFPSNNLTNESILIIRHSNDSGEIKTMPREVIEIGSASPKNIESTTAQQPALDGKDLNKTYFEYTETPVGNRKSGVIDDKPVNPNSEIDQEHKSVNLSLGRVSDSMIQPEIQHEYHTIPAVIEVSGYSERNTNINEKPKQESNAESEERHGTEKTDFGHGGSAETSMNSQSDVLFKGKEPDQLKVQETTTESHIAITTLFSVLSPQAVDGKMNFELTDEREKATYLRETVDKQSRQDINETTKSPEEFSNNIKDELLDNEEFNTLLGKEHIKEAGSNDGKELINKYPSKLHKVDKKKIKDYVKNEKLDSDKKTEATARPPVTSRDFVLQKDVNGNENTFDLEYGLQSEHTTKHDGEVTVINSHGFDGVPGVSFKSHGINNHDLRGLQTVAPDSNSETGQPQEAEVQKSDSKVKLLDNREGEKQDKDYAKFDKDYKYEKQKVSKKKDLKKKSGSGKDGKNVELDDGRSKYIIDASKENPDTSHELVKDVPETVSPFEKITVQPEIGVKLISGSADETTAMPDYKGKVETTFQPSNINSLEKRTEAPEVVPEYTGQPKSISQEIGSTTFGKPNTQLQYDDQHRRIPVDQSYHQMIDEPSVKTMSSLSPVTTYDGQLPESINFTDSGTGHLNINSSGPFAVIEKSDLTTKDINIAPGTVFDGIANGTTSQDPRSGIEINDTMVDGGVRSTPSVGPKIVTSGDITSEYRVINNTTANPTIIIHGQSGSLQNGHTLRFANSTFHNTGNATTVIPQLNGTFSHSDGQAYTITNYTTTFPNGSAVQPTIIVRGQSGTLQDGHELRFGNNTFITSLPSDQHAFKDSTVYKIENGSLPDTVFDGHFNPQNGHYHMFSNSSGTYVFSNVTAQPTFVIKGGSDNFGNSRAYVIANDNGTTFSRSFTGPSVIFRNSTVFAVGNAQGKDVPTMGMQEVTAPDVSSNETIHYTRQMSPNFFSTGTAYKVNNYFGYISKCAAGQFQCVNGTSKRGSACISLSSKCDSINDCSDGSDELGCIENGCPGNFQCSDGSCLKRNLVCNGILDCNDGSDEKQCESWKCEFDEFQCPSGRCIPVVWQCDGKPDCDNHTDEYNCQTSCGNDEYLCPEGWCVPLTYRCNGVKECNMGEDEQLCECSHEEFKCQTGGCVSVKQICDGLEDCPDRSDEWDCVKLEPGSNLLKIKTGSGDFEPVCADDWTSQNSDDVCASLGYYSSVPIENERSSSITTETSFFILKNGSTDNLNKKVIVNLKKSDGNCSSGKLVAVNCQNFSCGSRSMTDSSSVEARLVGGMSATAGQWPSVALLYNNRNFHSCTANILTPRWVLASYNCLKMGNKNLNEQDWKFFGGSTVFETEKENAETRKILSIIPHPQVKFNQFLFSNDLALVELDQSLQFTSNLGAVCLPEQEMQPRQICVTAGWGMNAPEDKSIRQQLQYLPVPTMNLTECNSTEHYSGFITDDKICAGYNSAQKSLCYNEEGAPLLCVNDRGEWELQGVLSYHSTCSRGSHPSIFSSITPVTDWIKKTIGNPFERKVVAITKR